MKRYSRRQFIAKGGKYATGIALGIPLVGAYCNTPLRAGKKMDGWRDYRLPGWKKRPMMAVASKGSPSSNLNAALKALGGIGKFVNKGERVLLKPNIGWDRTPEQAANTNPQLVKEMARLCLAAGAAQVIVTDVSCDWGPNCFKKSGIQQAAESAGARVYVPKDDDYDMVDIGGILGEWETLKVLYEVDRVINMPVCKHHAGTQTTINMKNWLGIVRGKRRKLHERGIHQSIADLVEAYRPTLCVVDATRTLMKGGPKGGNLANVIKRDIIAVGTDDVALDAYGTELLGKNPAAVEHITIAVKKGLGEMDYRKLKPISVKG